MWTLRLRGPKGKAATVQISPEMTLQAFCDLAMLQLAIKRGAKTHLTFRSGFPPRVVAYSPDDTVQSKFADNDSIVIDTAAPSAEPHQAVAPPLSTTTTTRTAKAKAKKEPVRTTGGVHTLTGGAAAKRTTTNKRKAADHGTGVRLGASLEEESVVVEEPSGPKYRRTQAVQLSSKDDIGIKLVEAVSGKSKDRVGKFFRAATKSAVEHQYEMTLANARLNAALSNKFEIVDVSQVQRATTDEAARPGELTMRVKFKETVRKWKEETVQQLQPTELQAALKYILISGGETGREMLKPFNMAQVSPRVFWSIARLYNGDVAAGLAELLPDEDWSFLDTRTRQRSKKAVEAEANEEHYKRWKKAGPTGAAAAAAAVAPTRGGATRKTGGGGSQEVIAIDSDGDEDEDEETKAAEPSDEQHLQSAMAYAEQAEKRMRHRQGGTAAVTRVSAAIRESSDAKMASIADAEETESEVEEQDGEEEEEQEDGIEKTTTIYCDVCNKARILSLPEADAVGTTAETDQWTCARLASINRTASCEVLDDELLQMMGEQLASLLAKFVKIHTRQQLANANMATDLKQLAHPLDPTYKAFKARLEELIDEARLDEVNDAMLEIVGGNGRLLDLLELQKLGTPADLAETPPDLVVQELQRNKKRVKLEKVVQWQHQARDKIKSFPWMGEWRTV